MWKRNRMTNAQVLGDGKYKRITAGTVKPEGAGALKLGKTVSRHRNGRPRGAQGGRITDFIVMSATSGRAGAYARWFQVSGDNVSSSSETTNHVNLYELPFS